MGHARGCSAAGLLLHGGYWINHALRSDGQRSAHKMAPPPPPPPPVSPRVAPQKRPLLKNSCFFFLTAGEDTEEESLVQNIVMKREPVCSFCVTDRRKASPLPQSQLNDHQPETTRLNRKTEEKFSSPGWCEEESLQFCCLELIS